MADNKNNQIKNNNQPIEKNKDEKNLKSEPLIEYENGWTVEDTMALYPNLTREEAERAWRMGW